MGYFHRRSNEVISVKSEKRTGVLALDSLEVEKQLSALDGWANIEKKLEKVYSFKDFVGAILFVNRVAECAEEANHHPDILIHYNKVTLKLWTHTTGGITKSDLKLAAKIDEIL